MSKTNYYEITVILDGALDDKAVQAIVDRTADFISKHEGVIKSTNHWGRKKLAYLIEKKSNGYYFQMGVDATGSFVRLLERHFYIDNDILRYLILNVSDKEIKHRDESLALMQKAEAEAEALLNKIEVDDE